MRKNERIGPRRLPVFFVIAYLSVLSSSAFGFLLAQDGTQVQPDETVGELLSGSAPPETAVVSPASESLWRTTGVLILGGGLGVLLLLSWQRQRPSSGATRGGTAALDVISRATLSPKHTACLLKVGPDRLLVVALCGDAMSPLCTIEGEDEIGRVLGEQEPSSARAPWLDEEGTAAVTASMSSRLGGGGAPGDIDAGSGRVFASSESTDSSSRPRRGNDSREIQIAEDPVLRPVELRAAGNRSWTLR
ncbi:MAG: flagellar biosynthetic protein FliO [Planctomycetes bacterium]|nr:flagellar biosynthetic protein FliO [Planctomycetota bacterium]